ncbi:MAG: hypothetical protein ACC707_10340, partial [Thiohalomonadales bacterium]
MVKKAHEFFCPFTALLILGNLSAEPTYAASVKINGLLETTIRSDAHFDNSKSSDIVQASVEIAINAEISKWV